MRLSRLVLVAALSSLVLLSAPASALESLDEVRCLCASSNVNQGDHVSCLAKFTRRLVLLGIIDKVERANAVADASRDDLDAVRAGCASDEGNSLEVGGWGVGLQVGTAFYPAPAPSDPASAALVSLYLWNFSPADVLQTTPVAPAGDCVYVVRIVDEAGNVVRSDDSVCLPTFGRFDMPMGSVEQRDFVLPLLALNAETGLADGTRLPSGSYRVEVSWDTLGPDADDMPSSPGLAPTASITIRVGT
jgi:hypothetical protein